MPSCPEALLAWYAESNELLLSALREAGPEREYWTWWAAGVSPANAWGVARRRVHEVLVHTYDAQLAAGAVQPMPADGQYGLVQLGPERLPQHRRLSQEGDTATARLSVGCS